MGSFTSSSPDPDSDEESQNGSDTDERLKKHENPPSKEGQDKHKNQAETSLIENEHEYGKHSLAGPTECQDKQVPQHAPNPNETEQEQSIQPLPSPTECKDKQEHKHGSIPNYSEQQQENELLLSPNSSDHSSSDTTGKKPLGAAQTPPNDSTHGSSQEPIASNVFGAQTNTQALAVTRDLHLQQDPIISEGSLQNIGAHGFQAQAAQNITNNISYIRSDSRRYSALLDEVFNCLTEMLKAKHREVRRSSWPWNASRRCQLDQLLVEPVVVSKGDRSKRLHGKEIQLYEIIKPVKGKRFTRILIEGLAGYGKSTLALRLCSDYAKSEDYIKEYEVLILISLNEFKGSRPTLDEMISTKLKLQQYTSESILHAITKHQESTLIILDEYDESNQEILDIIKPLLEKVYLPKATVLFTLRQSYVNEVFNFDKRYVIKGANRFQLFQQILQSCSEQEREIINDFLSATFDTELTESSIRQLLRKFRKALSLHSWDERTLFDCPLFLLLAVAIAKCSKPRLQNIRTLATKTDEYKKYFNFFGQKILRITFDSEEDLFLFHKNKPPASGRALSQFGTLALSALAEKQLIFPKYEVLNQCPDHNVLCQMGLLTEQEVVDGNAGAQNFRLNHLNTLRFCAAYHIWFTFQCQPSHFAFLTPFLENRSLENVVFAFAFGLYGEKLQPFFATIQSGKLEDHSAIQLASDPQEKDTFIHVSRDSLALESPREINFACELLSSLVPTIWHTSYFKDSFVKSSSTALLKETVAEAAWLNLLETIVYDCTVTWDILTKKNLPLIPLFALMMNISCNSLSSFGEIQCGELRVFLDLKKKTIQKSVKIVMEMIPKIMQPSVITFVVTDLEPDEMSMLVNEVSPNFDVYILNPLPPYRLQVVKSKHRKNDYHIGDTVDMYRRLPWLEVNSETS